MSEHRRVTGRPPAPGQRRRRRKKRRKRKRKRRKRKERIRRAKRSVTGKLGAGPVRRWSMLSGCAHVRVYG